MECWLLHPTPCQWAWESSGTESKCLSPATEHGSPSWRAGLLSELALAVVPIWGSDLLTAALYFSSKLWYDMIWHIFLISIKVSCFVSSSPLHVDSGHFPSCWCFHPCSGSWVWCQLPGPKSSFLLLPSLRNSDVSDNWITAAHRPDLYWVLWFPIKQMEF